MTLGEASRTTSRHPELAEHLGRVALNRNGPFELASGKQSPYYLDAKLTGLDPEGISLAVDAIAAETRDVDFEAIGGLELGAAPIIGAFVYQSLRAEKAVRGFIVRKKEKAHGTRKRIEGPLPETSSRVVIVDDVVTSGKSIMEAISAVRQRGHKVVLAISVVDRGEGAAKLLQSEQVEYRPLVTALELGISDHVDSGGGQRSASESL